MKIRRIFLILEFIYFLVILLLLIGSILYLNNNIMKSTSKKYNSNELKHFKYDLKCCIEAANKVILSHYNLTKNNSKDLINKEKKMVLDELKNWGYEKNKRFFLIIENNEDKFKILRNSLEPDLEGKILNSKIKKTYQSKDEINSDVYKQIVKIAIKKDEGYINHKYASKAKNKIVYEPATTYYYKFDKWDWIIVASFFDKKMYNDKKDETNQLNKNITIKSIEIILIYVALSIFMIILVYKLLLKLFIKPVNEIISFLEEVSNGKLGSYLSLKIRGTFELDLIKRHLKDTIGELSIMIDKVNKKAVIIYQSFMETKIYIDELKNNLNDIVGTTKNLTSSVEETTSTTQQMSSVIETVEVSIAKIIAESKLLTQNMENNKLNEIYKFIEELYPNVNNMLKGINEVILVNSKNAEATDDIAKNILDILIKAEELAKHAEKLRQTAFDLMESIGVFST